MNIDLNKLNYSKEIILNDSISFDNYDLKSAGINALNNLNITGTIKYNAVDNIELDLTLSGNMILSDAITLDDIIVPLNIEINETLENNDEISEYFKKSENTLDIMGVLWQNIVLEVPIRITKVAKSTIASGDGWELKDENTRKQDPRLAELYKLLDDGRSEE